MNSQVNAYKSFNKEKLNVREEAAALFSGSEPTKALELLISYLNSHLEEAPQSVWFMLMDGYRALNKKNAFNACARMFASYFKTSPPSWDDVTVEATSYTNLSPSIQQTVLTIDGPVSSMDLNLFKEFTKSSKVSKEGTLDLSRAILSKDEIQRIDDLSILLKFMKKIRKNNVSILLMGEDQFVEVLRKIITSNESIPSIELYWELVLEFLQWRGQKESFEEMAILFARQFSKSAPGYEEDGVVAIPPTEKIEDIKIDAISPPSLIDEDIVLSWCEELSLSLPHDEEVLKLDFSNVHRITYKAAQILTSKLVEWELPRHNIVVFNPSELILALFEVSGISQLVTIENRRR